MEKFERSLYYSNTELKERNWNARQIKKLLAEVDNYRPNPRFKTAAPMRFWLITKVEQLEKSDDFLKLKTSAARKLGAKKAVETKTSKLLADIEKMPVHVTLVPKVVAKAVKHYNDYRFQMGYDFECASIHSDISFLDRITVNYIRHNLTEYDSNLEKIAGKVGIAIGVNNIRAKIFQEIINIYPQYTRECKRQQTERQSL